MIERKDYPAIGVKEHNEFLCCSCIHEALLSKAKRDARKGFSYWIERVLILGGMIFYPLFILYWLV